MLRVWIDILECACIIVLAGCAVGLGEGAVTERLAQRLTVGWLRQINETKSIDNIPNAAAGASACTFFQLIFNIDTTAGIWCSSIAGLA
jgi:hypothetical protein